MPLVTSCYCVFHVHLANDMGISAGPEEAILKWSGQGVGTMKYYRKVWGHAPPRKIFKIACSEIKSETVNSLATNTCVKLTACK